MSGSRNNEVNYSGGQTGLDDLPGEQCSPTGCDSEFLPILLTSIDLLAGLGLRFAHLTEVSVEPVYGSIFDNGDNTWTFRPSVSFSGESVPLRFKLETGGHVTEVVNQVSVLTTLSITHHHQVESRSSDATGTIRELPDLEDSAPLQ